MKKMIEMPRETIKQSLMTARLFDGFWDRWLAHGLIASEISTVRNYLTDVQNWVNSFGELANQHEIEAKRYERLGFYLEAENQYRLAALHYNLVQWIFPGLSKEKKYFLSKMKLKVSKADQLSNIDVFHSMISVDGKNCFGRIRVPADPVGVIIIVNPIDSTKEELFLYEKQFIESGYITISFDGPGQGETLMISELKSSFDRWEIYMNRLIDFAAHYFPNQSINLFGSSSGAMWAIYYSHHAKVNKVAAVSPAIISYSPLPSYFEDRLNQISDDFFLPRLNQQESYSNILVFHGNKDVMVSNEGLYELYEQLSAPKKLIEFPNEGHCCNFELTKVRELTMNWFEESGI